MKKIKMLLILFLFVPYMIKADSFEIGSFDELKNAITNGENDIKFTSDIVFDDKITVSSNIKIDGNNHNFNRKAGYTGNLFTISSAGSLEISNVKIDLGAPGWSMDYDNRYYTQANNKGYVRVPVIDDAGDITASASLISNAGNLKIVNSEIKNGRSTASGTIINGAGNNEIINTTFEHIFSSKNGGMLYVNGGTTILKDFHAKEGVSGLPSSSATGAVLYIIGGTLLDAKNILIEDNFTQGNGAMFISRTNTVMDEVTFKHNMCGNDGSAISMESSVEGKTFSLTNGVFEDNIGFADTGQSMGTIWLAKWPSTADTPIKFKNVVFKNNKNKCGGGIADIGYSDTYVEFDNVEVLDNNSEVQSGSFIYGQQANYTIKNSKFHDNSINAGGVIYTLVSSVNIDNCEFYNNNTNKAGGSIYSSGGIVTITNTTFNNNTSGTQGGAIFFRSYYEDFPSELRIENSTIKDNSSSEGGGIAITDYSGLYSSVIIDDKTKIYDNTASTSGDDFQYKRGDDVAITDSDTLTLTNISIAGITGIDGWYNDLADDRFATTDNPTQFNDYINYSGTRISLKAAGVSTIDYDLLGGSNDSIDVVTVKYGVETQISDEVPEKEGCIFTGWNTSASGDGTDVQPGSTYDGKGGLMLYAQYVDDKNNNGIDDSTERHYTVTFLEGDNGSLDGQTVYSDILVGLSFSDAGIVIPTINANNGYQSAGWDNNPDGIIDSDLVFTALYQQKVEKNPKTGDYVYVWFTTFIISLFCLIGSVVLLRNNKIQN